VNGYSESKLPDCEKKGCLNAVDFSIGSHILPSIHFAPTNAIYRDGSVNMVSENGFDHRLSPHWREGQKNSITEFRILLGIRFSALKLLTPALRFDIHTQLPQAASTLPAKHRWLSFRW
jgi:hypothetical protein